MTTEELVVRITTDTAAFKRGMQDVNSQLNAVGSKASGAFSKAGSALKSIGGVVAKGAIVGIAAVGTATLAIGKQALDAYSSYEQLSGGVQKLFGDSASTVENYANNAFKTAGMSANDYMETVTSFSASLISSLGGDTAKAAEQADKAVSDMSDNANTFGTDIKSIQNAYSGFAKQNYTMLDNLKLGYGGTKEEMQRLLSDAEAISGVHYDLNNYSDVVDAIHVIQEQHHIAGTTAREAATTIEGSVNAAKGAWSNWVAGLGKDNADMGKLTGDLVDSVVTAAGNILPRIAKIGKSLLATVPKIITKIGSAIKSNLPKVLNSAGKLVTSTLPKLLSGIISKIKEVFPKLVSAVKTEAPKIATALVDGIKEKLTGAFGNLPIFETLSNSFSSLKSSFSGLFDTLKEAFSPIIQAFQELWGKTSAQEKQTTLLTVALGALSAVFNIIATAVRVITAVIQGIITAIKTVINFIANFKANATAQFNALKVNITKAVSNIKNAIINTFNSAKSKAVAIFNALKSTVTAVFQKLRSTVTSVASGMRSSVTYVFSGLRSSAVSIISGLRSSITSIFSGIRSSAISIASGMRSGVSSAFSGILGSASSIFNGVRNTITNAIYGAKNAVGNAISTMRSFFNFSWSLPHIALPHISVSGKFSINPPSAPHFGISWYAKGGVFDSPSIIGVGEAGQEAVMPLEHNTGWIDTLAGKLQNRMGGTSSSDRPVNIVLQVDRQRLGKVAIASINDIIEQEGAIPLAI